MGGFYEVFLECFSRRKRRIFLQWHPKGSSLVLKLLRVDFEKFSWENVVWLLGVFWTWMGLQNSWVTHFGLYNSAVEPVNALTNVFLNCSPRFCSALTSGCRALPVSSASTSASPKFSSKLFVAIVIHEIFFLLPFLWRRRFWNWNCSLQGQNVQVVCLLRHIIDCSF